ncbi:hypothetical protein AB1Y20_005423 [Prymnesium parvum]|uniref:ABC transporter domain-containing protein n=1 Tax=Prymnesium parvum TaxID=97485 RepID=A0AB34J5R3_PRYPA
MAALWRREGLLPREARTSNGPSLAPRTTASLDRRFCRQLSVLLHLAMSSPSPLCVVAELFFGGTVCLAVLCLLGVKHAPPLGSVSLVLLQAGGLVVCVVANLLAHSPPPGRRARSLLERHSFALQFLTVQAYNVAGFFSSLVPSMMYSVLIPATDAGSGEHPTCDSEFFHVLLQSAGYLGATAVAKAAMMAAEQGAALVWRRALTARIQASLDAEVLYDVQLLEPTLDNPDQRVTREVELWCTTLATIVTAVGQSVFNLVWYSYQTWTITGWVGPLLIYGFFLVSALCSRLAASPVAAAVAQVEAAEGAFRRIHVDFASRAESVCLSGGGKLQRAECTASLSELVRRRCSLIVRQLLLNLVLFTNDYAGSAVNYLALAIPICSGFYSDRSPRQIAELGSTFAILLVYGCTQLVDTATQASQLAGYTHRIASLYDAMLDARRLRAAAAAAERLEGFRGGPPEDGGDVLTCAGVEVHVAASMPRRLLLRGVSFRLARGGSLLLTGAAGSGKSSLLRVLHGLWPATGGSLRCVPPLQGCVAEGGVGAGAGKASLDGWAPLELRRSSRGGVGLLEQDAAMFLPQSPLLMRTASIREQLAFPHSLEEFFPLDADVLSALQMVQLEVHVERLGGLDRRISHWGVTLSPGQQQLLCLARLFIHRPALAVLDEATSAVTVDSEARVYKKLKEMGIAVLSVGHRSSLSSLHDTCLALDEHMQSADSTSPGTLAIQEAERGGLPVQPLGPREHPFSINT